MFSRPTRNLLATVVALSGLAMPTTALDLEAPESVTGPYMPISAWEIGPVLTLAPPPIPSAWQAWHKTTSTDPIALLSDMRNVLLDWYWVLSDASLDLRQTANSIRTLTRPMLVALVPAPSSVETTPTVPLAITLPIAGIQLLASLGKVSFEPHADLAWAEVPQQFEQPYRLITFLGEGEKPHGTLDFAGYAPSTETIPAE